MDVPPNPTPDPVQSVFDQVTGILSNYGWTILFILIVLNLLWSHFYPKYKKWQERVEEQEKEAEYKKDPSRIIAREEAMARARQRMAEEHERLAREYEEKMKEKERKKREEKLAEMESLVYGKPKPSKNSSALRQDYNPLMGGGSSSSCYRPSRRGGPGGGGG
ncbi:selenoprotein S-like [Argiope bruennichi]|uniref:Selenoprotein S n=1 Tax=Argiope bruennichi TaxID=94029 RepID=A0A8T0EPP7_ARGBR|nr:selenoprotein S-like [Argiope bruennichi]KAF8777707.1 hypothetical protein HNY73_014523 [Argiope bruennichi]